MNSDEVSKLLLLNFQLVCPVLRGISETLGPEVKKEGEAGIFAQELAQSHLDDAERELDEQGNMIGATIAVHFDAQLNQAIIQLRQDLFNLRREIAQPKLTPEQTASLHKAYQLLADYAQSGTQGGTEALQIIICTLEPEGKKRTILLRLSTSESSFSPQEERSISRTIDQAHPVTRCSLFVFARMVSLYNCI